MELGAKYGCHQRPDRSFFVGEYQFPVCARCTGVLISSMLAPVFYVFVVFPIKVYILMIAIMGLDGGIQYMGLKESTNIRRFVTGCVGGFGLTSIKISAIHTLYKKIKHFVGE